MQQSNLLIARFSLLLLVCISRAVFWTAPRRLGCSFNFGISEVEQPGSSKLVFIPYVQHIVEALDENLSFKRLRLDKWLSN